MKVLQVLLGPRERPLHPLNAVAYAQYLLILLLDIQQALICQVNRLPHFFLDSMQRVLRLVLSLKALLYYLGLIEPALVLVALFEVPLLVEHEQTHLVSFDVQLQALQLQIVVSDFFLVILVLLPKLSLSLLGDAEQLLLKVDQLLFHLSE